MMTKPGVLNELLTLTTCLESLSELVGAANEEHFSSKKVATLLGYIHDRQEKLLSQITTFKSE